MFYYIEVHLLDHYTELLQHVSDHVGSIIRE
jgi:hypothetical protein